MPRQEGLFVNPLAVARDVLTVPVQLLTGLRDIGAGLSALTAEDSPLHRLHELEHLPEVRYSAAVLPDLPPRVAGIEAQMTEMVEHMRTIGPALDELSQTVTRLQASLGELEATVAAVSRLVPGAGRRRRARGAEAA